MNSSCLINDLELRIHLEMTITYCTRFKTEDVTLLRAKSYLRLLCRPVVRDVTRIAVIDWTYKMIITFKRVCRNLNLNERLRIISQNKGKTRMSDSVGKNVLFIFFE